MINKIELEVAITRAGIQRGELAEKLGISRMSLQNKMNGTYEFKASEIAVLIKLLNIDDPMNIFFNGKVNEIPQKNNTA